MAVGCGERGDSADGGAASASPRVEEPPPVPPASVAPAPAPAAPPVPPDVSPTVDSWEAEADDALLTPEENNEPDEEEIDPQVQNTVIGMVFFLSTFSFFSPCGHKLKVPQQGKVSGCAFVT